MARAGNVKVINELGTEPALVGQTLIRAVNSYNKAFSNKQKMCKVKVDQRDNSFIGGVKIHMCIRNSLNLRSTLNLGKNGSLKTRLRTKFKFRPRAAEILQVNNLTTVKDVINHIIEQFRIQESPRQFALFERTTHNSKTEVTHRKLDLKERPLVLSLLWCTRGLAKRKRLILCDHDPDYEEEAEEVNNYQTNTLEELQDMLDKLNKEEEAEVKAIHTKYSQLLQMFKGALDKRRAEMLGSCPDIYSVGFSESSVRRRQMQRSGLQRSLSLAESDASTLLSSEKSRTGCILQ